MSDGEPTDAELARTVLAAAGSLTLTTERHRMELVGSHAVEARARLLLDIPAHGRLSAEFAAGPDGVLAATADFTDIAPVSVPDRVRARLRLHGSLSRTGYGPGASTALRFEPAAATLQHAGDCRQVGPEDLARAEPDPMAETEAEILLHLTSAHQDAIEVLSQLVEPRLLFGVTRVAPLRLDRYGIVLRLQRAGGHRDARLAFPEPLGGPAQALLRIQTMLAHARRCPRRHRQRR